MYKLYKYLNKVVGAYKETENGTRIVFEFNPDNTDYQNFKKQINADEAQLEDADGNLMTAEQAKEFVSTLP